MGTIRFATENRADDATVSGGAYQATLPVTNLLVPYPTPVARTLDATLASTKFDIDFLTATVPIRFIGIMKHNCTQQAQYRITMGSSVGLSNIYDSGWKAVWPPIYTYADLPFEDPRFWTGQMSVEEAKLYVARLFHDAGTILLGRYMRIEISDTANTFGYIELTRLWTAALLIPSVNYVPGATLTYKPRDRVSVSRNGRRYSEHLDPVRGFRFRFDALKDAEAFGPLLDAMRRLGSEGEMIVIADPDDLSQGHRRNLWCRLENVDGPSQQRGGLQTATLTVEELI